jgi:CubicO group peptidase (beta-lactamase class C family)
MVNVAMAQIRFLMQAAVVGTLVDAGICTVQSDGMAAQLATSASHRDVAAAFDEAIRGWMAKYGVQRGSIAVMHNNRLAFAAGYGGRGANERIPVWSLSKAITALCIATLVSDGKFRFDDPIGPLLSPVFQRFGQPADERLGRITVGQLLSHRSGIPRAFGRNSFVPGVAEVLRRYEPREASVDMLMPEIIKLSLARPPGEGYEYSNVGYILLGKIIETAAGKPLNRPAESGFSQRQGSRRSPPSTKAGAGSRIRRAAGRYRDLNILASRVCSTRSNRRCW